MPKLKPLFVAPFILALVVAGQATGQLSDFASPVAFIVSADTDQDGRLSLDEAQAAAPFVNAFVFALVDANADGFISLADFVDSPLVPVEDVITELVALADADGDGDVTLDEVHTLHPGLPSEEFLLLDFDGDGVVSLDDLNPTDPTDPTEPQEPVDPGEPCGPLSKVQARSPS